MKLMQHGIGETATSAGHCAGVSQIDMVPKKDVNVFPKVVPEQEAVAHLYSQARPAGGFLAQVVVRSYLRYLRYPPLPPLPPAVFFQFFYLIFGSFIEN